jgi:hypothetical protein
VTHPLALIQSKQSKKNQKQIIHPPKAPKIKSKKNWKHIIHPQIQKPRKKKKKKILEFQPTTGKRKRVFKFLSQRGKKILWEFRPRTKKKKLRFF